jgi:chemotaxis protein histidine kinase CheA
MATNFDNRKLDELAKRLLGAYEPETAETDWATMEGLLNLTHKVKSASMQQQLASKLGGLSELGIAKKIVSPYVAIILIVLSAGAYLIYHLANTPKTDEQPLVTTTLPAIDTSAIDTSMITKVEEVKPPLPKVDTLALIAAKTDSIAKFVKDSIEKATFNEKEEKAKIKEEEELKAKNREAEKKEKELADKKAKKEEEAKKVADKKAEKKKEEAKKAAAKEKELAAKKQKAVEAKKKADEASKNKSDNVIGLGGFILRGLNVDSLKKIQNQQEAPKQPVLQPVQQSKDSVKTK